MDTGIETTRCKFCNSSNVIRYGYLKNIQRWWCKDCKHKFADNNSLPGMKTPVSWLSSTMDMYYRGTSFNAIQQKLRQKNIFISNSTIYDWVAKFTRRGLEEISCQHPIVGDTWYIHENSIKVNGKKYSIFDCFDEETRFLLASLGAYRVDTPNIEFLIDISKDKAGKTPSKVIVNEGMQRYIEIIGSAFSTTRKHASIEYHNTRETAFLKEQFKNIKEIIESRAKVLRGLKDIKNTRTILDGWAIFYNYFIPQESLNGETPAEKSHVQWTAPW